jgi:hypothetical protein
LPVGELAVASLLKNPAHLFPLYGLLFSVPGIPSIYYGGEYGTRGEREAYSDAALRPSWGFVQEQYAPRPEGGALFQALCRFAAIRKAAPALTRGGYRELFVSAEQFAFLRECVESPSVPANRKAIIAVNSGGGVKPLRLCDGALGPDGTAWRDLLSGERFAVSGGALDVLLHPSWLRILVPAAV